jgi:hypothetical protein
MTNKMKFSDRIKLIVPDKNGCLIWHLSKYKRGYGIVMLNGRPTSTHRASYALRYGEIPSKMLIHHICENPSCLNTQHLKMVSAKEHRKISPNRYGSKKYCKNGHKFTKRNTIFTIAKRKSTPYTYRRCRECHRKEAEIRNEIIRKLKQL